MTLNLKTNILIFLLAPVCLAGQGLLHSAKTSEADSLLQYTYELSQLHPSRAIDLAHNQQRTALDDGDSLLWADALRVEGEALLKLNNIRGARNVFNEALFVYRQNSDSTGMGASLLNLATIENMLGHHFQALLKIDAGLKAAQNPNTISLRIQLLMLRSRVELGQGDVETALATAHKALALSKKLHQKSLRGEVYILLAEIVLEKGQAAQARSYLDFAMVINEGLGNFGALARAHGIYARVWYAFGNMPRANEEISAGLGLARAHAFPHTYTEQLLLHSNILLASGDTLQALNAALRADSISRLAPVVKPLTRDITRQLSEIYMAAGDSAKALSNLLRFRAIDDSIKAYDVQAMLLKKEFEQQKTAYDRLSGENQDKERLIGRSKMLLLLAAGLMVVLVLLIGALVRSVQRKRRYSKHLVKKSQAIKKKQESDQEQQAALKAQNERLTALDKNKNKIFSVLTHDLRQPISQVKSVLNLLEMEGMSNEDRKTIVEKLKESVDNSSNALENLLLWSKKQLTGISTRIVDVHLLPQVWLLESQVKPNLEAKELTLEIKVPEFYKVMADMNQLDICMRNMVNNAIKFSNRGGKIIIEATEDSENKIIKVIDNGLGMAPDQLDKLKELTANFSTTGTMNERGTGLGVLITHEFMQGQNGRLHMESEKGVGSTFSLILPKNNKDYKKKLE